MKDRDLTRFGRDEFLMPFSTWFDKLVTEHWPELGKEFGLSFGISSRPRVDIKEFDDKIQLIAEVAGLTKDEVHISVDDGVLTIYGAKKEKVDKSKGNYVHVELAQSNFSRSFGLGESLDGKNIKAEFKDGLLTIDIPRIEPKKTESYKIEIK